MMRMNVKGLVCLLLIISGTAAPAFSQKANKKKVNASLNIGKKMNDSTQVSYVNLGFLTHIHQLEGAGINVISSMVKDRVSGLQASGIANISGGNVDGLQVAGITNVNGNNVSGVTLSGFVNITGKNTNGLSLTGGIGVTGKCANGVSVAGLLNTVAAESNGLQLSGIANITGEHSNGAMISGLLNVTGSNLNGMQLSTLLNVAGDQVRGLQLSALGNVGVNVKGVQLSGLGNVVAETLNGLQISPLANVAKNVRGVQAGVMNYCMGDVKGVQVGLVNYSKDSSTVKIGLVNLNPLTRVQLLAYGGNTTKINLGVRFLNRMTYTMLGVGAQYLGLNEKFSLTTSYRAGLYFRLIDQLAISGDLGFAHIESFKNKERPDIPARMYSLQARINLEYHPVKRFGLFASGGYAHTRHYHKGGTFENKPVFEVGIVLF